ncbi:asparagine--tRNA ligase [Malassezia vespertilionis]|uniref:asparagine--tRNA ligase n=1 Tax=Malassezia vespertilionis TaxID=2020962 RepID=UPI0024B1F350|nr:asparagine--tRNA ligase [Malassezia vespertilionis]WFD04746.1 asparagine--tRNA ligase [Malassezia vespertilionis]
MEERVVDLPVAQADIEEQLAPPIAWIPSHVPVTTDVPEPLAHMLDMLVTGTLRGQVAEPVALDMVDTARYGDVVRASPIAVIQPVDESGGSGAQDWIVVIQVRSTGAVRRVATELGGYLKHTVPPSTSGTISSLDTLLGPPKQVEEPSKPQAPRPAGMSRIEHEMGTRLPAWQIQKIALSRKFPDGWSPMSKLSHEAQHGLRVLHDADPDRFNALVLSKRFRISPESVRRILKSRWEPNVDEANRQNHRAMAAEAMRKSVGAYEREQAELQELRGEIDLDVAPRSFTQAPTGAHAQPVRFEGLVSSADLAAGSKKQKSVASRGSGDWCLIDAGWIVVHVMLDSARARYRIEDMWREETVA